MLEIINRVISYIQISFKKLINYFFYNKRIFALDLKADELTWLLENRKIDPNVVSSNGLNPLHMTCLSPLVHSGRYIHLEKMDILLAAGTNPNQQSHDINFRNTPLHLFIANEFVKEATHLIDKCKELKLNINFNLRDINQATPLILASKVRREEIAMHILSQINNSYIDVNARDKDGMTAIHYAALLGQIKLYDKLIEVGADISLKNNLGQTCDNLLQVSEDKIKNHLKSMEIKPKRDENACLNHFHDLNRQSLVINTRYADQKEGIKEGVVLPPLMPIRLSSKKKNIDAIKQILDKKPVAFIDSNALLFEHAIKPMNDENKKYLTHQFKEFSGRSLLQKCLEGRKDIKTKKIRKRY